MEAMLGLVVMIVVSGATAVPVRRSAAERILVTGPAPVKEKNGGEVTTVMSDVLPPRVLHSAERSAPTADRVRAGGMSGRAVTNVVRAARIPRVQPSEAVIVPMIDHVPVTAANGPGMIVANAAPVPRARRSVARIVPLVVLVPGARVNDRWMTKARSWDPFVRAIARRNQGARPKAVQDPDAPKETSLPRR